MLYGPTTFFWLVDWCSIDVFFSWGQSTLSNLSRSADVDRTFILLVQTFGCYFVGRFCLYDDVYIAEHRRGPRVCHFMILVLVHGRIGTKSHLIWWKSTRDPENQQTSQHWVQFEFSEPLPWFLGDKVTIFAAQALCTRQHLFGRWGWRRVRWHCVPPRITVAFCLFIAELCWSSVMSIHEQWITMFIHFPDPKWVAFMSYKVSKWAIQSEGGEHQAE